MNVEEWVKAIKEDLEREDLPESYKKVLKVVLNLIESVDLRASSAPRRRLQGSEQIM